MKEIHNIELEQNILGCFLLNNQAFHAVSGLIAAEHFYDPVHRDIFEAIDRRIKRDELVSPVTMKTAMEAHEGLVELGGPKYLVRLAGAATMASHIKGYVAQLIDVYRKRKLQAVLWESLEGLEGEDSTTGEVLGRIEAETVDIQEADSTTVSMLSATHRAAEIVEDAYHSEEISGVKSGIVDLDKMTGGMRPADLVLLGGRPSMGKTAVALSMALSAARNGDGVIISSLEMTPDSLAMRAVSNQTAIDRKHVPYFNALRGDLTEDQAKAFFESTIAVSKLPIEILPTSIRDTGGIYAAVKRAQRVLDGKGSPAKLIIVDYLQLISIKGNSRTEEITKISIALKGLAMRTGLPVLALSQLSRAVENRTIDNRRPMLSDLRESGQLEQDADMVLFCYRHEYYLEREAPPDHDIEAKMAHQEALDRSRGKLEIIVAKQRMGPIGTVRVGFSPETNFIWDER